MTSVVVITVIYKNLILFCGRRRGESTYYKLLELLILQGRGRRLCLLNQA